MSLDYIHVVLKLFLLALANKKQKAYKRTVKNYNILQWMDLGKVGCYGLDRHNITQCIHNKLPIKFLCTIPFPPTLTRTCNTEDIISYVHMHCRS